MKYWLSVAKTMANRWLFAVIPIGIMAILTLNLAALILTSQVIAGPLKQAQTSQSMQPSGGLKDFLSTAKVSAPRLSLNYDLNLRRFSVFDEIPSIDESYPIKELGEFVNKMQIEFVEEVHRVVRVFPFYRDRIPMALLFETQSCKLCLADSESSYCQDRVFRVSLLSAKISGEGLGQMAFFGETVLHLHSDPSRSGALFEGVPEVIKSRLQPDRSMDVLLLSLYDLDLRSRQSELSNGESKDDSQTLNLSQMADQLGDYSMLELSVFSDARRSPIVKFGFVNLAIDRLIREPESKTWDPIAMDIYSHGVDSSKALESSLFTLNQIKLILQRRRTSLFALSKFVRTGFYKGAMPQTIDVIFNKKSRRALGFALTSGRYRPKKGSGKNATDQSELLIAESNFTSVGTNQGTVFFDQKKFIEEYIDLKYPEIKTLVEKIEQSGDSLIILPEQIGKHFFLLKFYSIINLDSNIASDIKLVPTDTSLMVVRPSDSGNTEFGRFFVTSETEIDRMFEPKDVNSINLSLSSRDSDIHFKKQIKWRLVDKEEDVPVKVTASELGDKIFEAQASKKLEESEIPEIPEKPTEPSEPKEQIQDQKVLAKKQSKVKPKTARKPLNLATLEDQIATVARKFSYQSVKTQESFRAEGIVAAGSVRSAPRAVISAYIDDWAYQVRKAGKLNFPRAIMGHGRVYKLSLRIGIKTDGTIFSLIVDKSSGNADLDREALAIIRQRAPYSKLPLSIQNEVKVLVITSHWTFSEDGVFQ